MRAHSTVPPPRFFFRLYTTPIPPIRLLASADLPRRSPAKARALRRWVHACRDRRPRLPPRASRPHWFSRARRPFRQPGRLPHYGQVELNEKREVEEVEADDVLPLDTLLMGDAEDGHDSAQITELHKDV